MYLRKVVEEQQGTSFDLPLLYIKKKQKQKKTIGCLDAEVSHQFHESASVRRPWHKLLRRTGFLVKYLEEVLAAGDSHTVITALLAARSFATSPPQKGYFKLPLLHTHTHTYTDTHTHKHTLRRSLCFRPLSCSDSHVPFLSAMAHVLYVTQEIFFYAESDSHKVLLLPSCVFSFRRHFL